MLQNQLKAFCRDRRGTVVIYVALAMPVLVGGMGLGGEAGYRYYNQRLLQHAADFSAHTAAVRKYKGDEKPAIDASALNVAAASGYENALGTIAVNIPPASGAFMGDNTATEVVLTETRPRLFSSVFSSEPVVIAARAVAAVTSTGQPACILALSETASGAVTVTGSTSTSLVGCSVASNSTAPDSFDMSGLGGFLTTDCVQATGGSDENQNLTLMDPDCPAPVENAPPVQDPYYWIMEPDTTVIPCQTIYPGANTSVGKPNQTTTVTPVDTWTHADGTVLPVMRFCNGLDVKGDVTFDPGLYIIENGNFTVSGTTTPQMSGEDVTFYFTNGGSAQIGASAQLNLAAPDDGAYSGILFFGGRNDPEAHDISGNSMSTLTGAVYMPASEVTFTGSSDGSNGCTQVIADTIELTGNSTLAIDCVDDGTNDILIGQIISIVE